MSKIIFKINGKQYEADGQYGPEVSLNDYIRTVADLRGTKAMCHEGGCGACIVAVRAPVPPSNEVKIFSVNSCLVSVLSCHGWEVMTVEGIGNRTMGYHEIQTRLAQFNGTQCGYCTPGWVMNMYSVFQSKNEKITMKEVENSFAGNICRCTGYRSIADAFKTFATDIDEKLKEKLKDIEDLSFFKSCGVACQKKCSNKNSCKKSDEDIPENGWCVLEKENNKMIVIDGGDHKWYKAYSLQDVFDVITKTDDYKLIAGNTGQGVYHVTEYPATVIDIFNVAELKGHTIDVNLIIGAGIPLSEMMELFLTLSETKEEFSYLKGFHEHMDLVAHVPVRNIGTIAGNLYLKYLNNEFQSDVFLLFETVGAMLTIAEGPAKIKVVSLIDFLTTDMKGKIIVNVLLPPLSNSCSFKSYKIMPRSQNAHAVVNAAFLLMFEQNSNILEKASLVFGSISPKFVHASKTEAVLVGKDPYLNETLQLALKTLFDEITPEEMPPEPSASYRKMLAVTLFYKAILYFCPNDKLDEKYRSGGEAIKRDISHGTQYFDTDKSVWPLNQPIPKIEALVQCAGEATFANDMPAQKGEVFGAFVTADIIAGSIISGFDTSEALKIPGVIAFYTAKDIPGKNTFTPLSAPLMSKEEEILCYSKVQYYGEPAAIIVADKEKTANKAAKLVKISYSFVNTNKPILTVDDVMKSPEKDKRLVNIAKIEPKEKGNDVKCMIYGEYQVGTQHHFYMEPQTSVAIPTENGMDVYTSSQWLDLPNIAIAETLNVPVNSVQIIIRRVGGGYGGKITRSCQIACAAALVTHLQGKTCRFILPLQNCLKIIGKRLPTTSNFEVAVNSEGEIQYMKHIFTQDNGCSPNETISGLTAMHLKSCYDAKRWYIEANGVFTDTPSNTWCRAPSSTEGVAMVEYIMERIAYNTGKDPLQVRALNMAKENNPVPELLEQLKKDCNYDERMNQVKDFNKANRWRKRALKILPMTYELFYIGPYNSIVSIYHGDGSVAVTHAGIEMGQGLNTKVAQVCAHILGIPLEKVSIKPSSSFTSPNAMTTGASVGSECVAFATIKACETLLERLKPIKEKLDKPTWEVLIKEAYNSGVELQAIYTYSGRNEITPYEICGVVAMEVEVDILSGNHDIRRVDLLEDIGRSMSPEVDITQIEGAFVMGIGYWTSENNIYDPKDGKVLTDRTWTYKPPGIKDIPADFRIYFRRNYSNPYGVLQSKATGEPALCLAVVITHALREAVRAARLDAGYEDQWVEIQNPCTVENIFTAVGHKLEHFKLK